MTCHPSGAGKMGIEGCARALGVAFGIDVKNYSCNFPPIGILGVSIQQPEIGDDVLLVIRRQHGIIRWPVCNIGIERGRRHVFPLEEVETASVSYAAIVSL
jgi:hypothetical protein